MSPSPGSRRQSNEERRRDVDYVALSGTVLVPVITTLVLPALHESIRVVVGLAVGLITLGLLIFYFGRTLRREIRRSTLDLMGVLTGFSADEASGTLFKGALRNVSLRVATIHFLLDRLLSAVPEERRDGILQDAGYKVGRSWGRDFIAECRRTGMEGSSLESRLQLWSDYDATAGMGRFEFALDRTGHGSAAIISGFLSDDDSVAVLDHFIAGYLRGTLEQLLDRNLRVTLLDPRRERHAESNFRIEPI